jgi:predicted GIY-YIG superfamily endonuclease
MYQVYILKNPAGRSYIGVTEDVKTRLAQHNSGVSTGGRSSGRGLKSGRGGSMAGPS